MGKVILAGDIGGTKTHLALFPLGEKRKAITEAKFKSRDYENLTKIIAEFLKDHKDIELSRACFGIAGPIRDNTCHATNLPWIIDAKEVGKKVGITEVFLINDLQANAYGISCLKEEEFFSLNLGKEIIGNRALISAGTGLGEAGFFWDGKKYHPFASEGGHCSFAPESVIEIELLSYLRKRYDHVSFERVLSGPGLYQIYQFLIEEKIEKETKEVRLLMESTPPAKVITEYGTKNSCMACARALEIFVSIYGGEASNLALKYFATGGIYVGGGIAPKMLNILKEGGFMKRFIGKGRFTSLLIDIPVKVVLNENTALFGAADFANRGAHIASI